MKKTTLAALAALLFPLSAAADITVQLPAGSNLDSLMYFAAPIAKYTTAKSREESGIIKGNIAVKDNKAVLTLDPVEGGWTSGIMIGQAGRADLFTPGGETILIDVTSLQPLKYTLSGSEIADALNEVNAISAPFEDRSRALYANGQPSQDAMTALYNEYKQALSDFIQENQTNQKSLLALMELSGEDLVDGFEKLSERAKTSIAYPLAEKSYQRAKAQLEKERAQQALAKGDKDAPAFTLDNPEGKPVSLADFKGKWVILDFWGSWCGWCIKGFPELKEAYAKYKDRLEIIGIDCNETKEQWIAGIKKHDLPWVNVYCPDGNKVISEYGVTGFPTKAIVNPEGKIVNITSGHNPAFFEALEKFMAQ